MSCCEHIYVVIVECVDANIGTHSFIYIYIYVYTESFSATECSLTGKLPTELGLLSILRKFFQLTSFGTIVCVPHSNAFFAHFLLLLWHRKILDIKKQVFGDCTL